MNISSAHVMYVRKLIHRPLFFFKKQSIYLASIACSQKHKPRLFYNIIHNFSTKLNNFHAWRAPDAWCVSTNKTELRHTTGVSASSSCIEGDLLHENTQGWFWLLWPRNYHSDYSACHIMTNEWIPINITLLLQSPLPCLLLPFFNIDNISLFLAPAYPCL